MAEIQLTQTKVILTTRDIRLLKLLAKHGLMSFTQVQEFVFPNRDHSTVLNRIKKIESAGLIARTRVHRIRHQLMQKQTGVVLQITMQGLKELHRLCPEMACIDKVMNLNSRQIDHDLLMVCLAESLRKEFPDKTYISGFHIQGLEVGEPRPDGAFTIPKDGIYAAIELELTQKSAERYREIIASYRVSRKFNRVIYFVETQALALKIASEITGYQVPKIENFKDRIFEIRVLESLSREVEKVAA